MPDAGRRTLPRALIRRAALAALLAVLLLAVTPAVVLTQDAFGLDGEGLGSSAGIAGGWDWVGLVLRLGLVLVAIWAVVVAMRWYLRRSGGAIGGGGRRGHLEVLEIRALGGQRSLQLVRLGERAVLLGVTPERISALLEVADPDELAQLTAPPEADAPGRPFSSFLAGMGGSMLAARRAARERVFGAGGEDAAPLPADAARRRAAATAYAGMRVVDLQRALEEPPGTSLSTSPRAAPHLAPDAAPPGAS